MRVYSYKEFSWKENDLFYQEELLYAVVSDEKYPSMFRIKWPDGILSADFYNLTRARDNAISLAMVQFNGIGGTDNDLDTQETV